MNTNIDPFADLEALILAAFEADTAHARAKRDEGMAHLQSLRENFGKNAASTADEPLPEIPEPVAPRTSNGFNATLKSAMVQAIDDLKEPITRGRVMHWVCEKYPKFADAKDGTIASTFSRVKGDYLEPIEGNDRFVFKRKEAASEMSVAS